MNEHTLVTNPVAATPLCRNAGDFAAVDSGDSLAGAGEFVYSTTCYEVKAIEALHQALEVMNRIESGPRLDALAVALKRLSQQCNDYAEALAGERQEHHAGRPEEAAQVDQAQRARTVADAVQAVSALAQGRALGELDNGSLQATWLRVWDTVALAQRPPSGA